MGGLLDGVDPRLQGSLRPTARQRSRPGAEPLRAAHSGKFWPASRGEGEEDEAGEEQAGHADHGVTQAEPGTERTPDEQDGRADDPAEV